MKQLNITSALSNNTNISFEIELGAYEFLWINDNYTFKKIADLFRQHPDSLPSNFVSKSNAIATYDKVMQQALETGVNDFKFIMHRTKEYPARLRQAQNPIELIYYQGKWPLTETKCVAIVGSRKVSQDGIQRTKQLARYLVKDGFTIVSGLAKGVDTEAHKTAIENNGNTIAVIGTPLYAYYPPENKELQNYISDHHLLLSQVPFLIYSRQDYRINRGYFPERNKTMSALTDATIIVEASDTSGTLIQARAAFYQGRKLFILDNCFRNKELSWPARFEKMGAIRVKSYEDIRRVLLNDNT